MSASPITGPAEAAIEEAMDRVPDVGPPRRDRRLSLTCKFRSRDGRQFFEDVDGNLRCEHFTPISEGCYACERELFQAHDTHRTRHRKGVRKW